MPASPVLGTGGDENESTCGAPSEDSFQIAEGDDFDGFCNVEIFAHDLLVQRNDDWTTAARAWRRVTDRGKRTEKNSAKSGSSRAKSAPPQVAVAAAAAKQLPRYYKAGTRLMDFLLGVVPGTETLDEYSPNAPPYSIRQLMYATILSSGEDAALSPNHDNIPCLSPTCIIEIIAYTFAYYNIPSDQPPNTAENFQLRRGRFMGLTKAVHFELGTFGAPFWVLNDSSVSVEIEHFDSILLGSVEESPSFEPFVRLPAELRLEIYRHALTYNYLDFHDSDFCQEPWCVACRDRGRQMHGFSTFINGRAIPWMSPNQVLGVLSVSRLVYEEAFPLFYLQTKFLFMSVPPLRNFLRGIGNRRRTYVRDIEVWYGARPGSWTADTTAANAAFTLLAETHVLKRFELVLPEERIVAAYKTVKKPTSIPGLWRLKKLRGVQEAVFTDCPEIEEYLKGDMTKPRQEEQRRGNPKRASRSRTRRESAIGATELFTTTADAIAADEQDMDE